MIAPQLKHDSLQLRIDAVIAGALQPGTWQDVMLRYAQAVDERDELIAILKDPASAASTDA